MVQTLFATYFHRKRIMIAIHGRAWHDKHDLYLRHWLLVDWKVEKDCMELQAKREKVSSPGL